MHRRMLLIRGFEERVSTLYRDGEVPGFVHLSIGQEASAVGACWPLRADRRDHVDPPRSRPLPRQGPGAARHVRRADGPRQRHEPRPRRLDAHRRPDDRDLRRQRHRRCGPADRRRCVGGRPAAGRRRRGRRVLRRRRGRPGRVPRGREPRRRVAAAGRSSGARTTGTPSSPRRRASTPHRSSIGRPGTASTTSASTATTSSATAATMARRRRCRARRSRPGDRRGDHVPLARSLRGRPAAVPDRAARWTPGRSATRSSCTPDGSSRLGVDAERGQRRWKRRWPRCSTRPSSSPRRSTAPDVATLGDFVVRPRPAYPGAAAAAGRRADLPHDGRDPRRARDRVGERRPRCSSPGSTSAKGGNVFGLTRGLHDKFGDRVRDTPISETAIMGLGVGAAMAGMRPVVEIMYLDFVGVCLDQLLNQAAKMPFMTGGNAEMALTVRTQFGAGRSSGQPALAEPRGAARPHPRPERRDAVDAGRHVRTAAGGDPGPQPGGVHREPPAVRHEGAQATRRPHRADRQVGRRAGRHRHHARLGVADGPRGAGGGRNRSPATGSRWR